MTLLERDKRAVWHPFTQAASAPAALPVVSAQGPWLHLEDGRKILDCISSWWTNIHGHSHPTISEFISRQAQQLDHVLFAGCTHEPAVSVAEEIIAATPAGLNRVFFSDNGSTAVEVAIKMAFQYWCNRGLPNKKGFIALEHAYHGDTVGAMSAGDPDEFELVFRDLCFVVRRIPVPRIEESPEAITAALGKLEQLLVEHGSSIAAMIVEPMVQGAGGMIIAPPKWLQQAAALCRQHNVLLIADEVMTGFGRTGKMFAVEHADVVPDIMCLAKGLTGGVLPLAASVVTDSIYDAFWDESMHKAFLHGHSFTANPIACAAALASFEIFKNEPVFERIRDIEAVYERRLPALGQHPAVRNVRWLGSIGGVELDVGARGYFNTIATTIRQRFLEAGMLIRPLGPVIYTLPPYVTPPEELERVFDTLQTILETELPS